jgi:hypothetical protein
MNVLSFIPMFILLLLILAARFISKAISSLFGYPLETVQIVLGLST